MPDRVIRNRRVEADHWLVIGLPPHGDLSALPAGPVIVPLAVWKDRRAELLDRAQPVGVWLAPDEEPGEIAVDLGLLPIVAVHFPKYGDGRGYSTGVLLRTRPGSLGELRAFGDIGRDHLFQLARFGFDSFRLADHRDPEAALAAFDEFT